MHRTFSQIISLVLAKLHVAMVAKHKSESDIHVVQKFLKEGKVLQDKQPACSSDLSPCDFYLPYNGKKMLAGSEYSPKTVHGSAFFQLLNIH